MRAAKARAASRRGCVCAMRPSMPRPISRQYCGSWVLFPDPVSPATTSTGCRRSASMISSRRADIGRSAPCLKTRSLSARGRAPAGRASIGTFDFLPQRLLRGETQGLEVLSAHRGQALHPAETAFEFHVGGAQRRLGVDIELASEIRRREQQIADLLEDL